MTTKPVPIEPVPTVDSGRIEDLKFGPYRDYQYVNPGFGEYAVPPGKILTFEIRTLWDHKEKMWVDRPWPLYEQVFVDDERIRPGVTRKTLADQAAREAKKTKQTSNAAQRNEDDKVKAKAAAKRAKAS